MAMEFPWNIDASLGAKAVTHGNKLSASMDMASNERILAA